MIWYCDDVPWSTFSLNDRLYTLYTSFWFPYLTSKCSKLCQWTTFAIITMIIIIRYCYVLRFACWLDMHDVKVLLQCLKNIQLFLLHNFPLKKCLLVSKQWLYVKSLWMVVIIWLHERKHFFLKTFEKNYHPTSHLHDNPEW